MAQVPTPPAESGESHLDCPACGYRLTGLPEDRCPECGAVFDRARLLLAASLDVRPVHPWDDRGSFGLVRAFCGTCMAMWFHPGSFASSFPRRHSSRSAWEFSLMCYGVASAVFLFSIMMLAIATGVDGVPIAEAVLPVFCIVCAIVAAIGCESLLALVLSRHFHVPNIPRAGAYHFWRGLMHFGSTYFILSAIGCALWMTLWMTLKMAGVSRLGLYGGIFPSVAFMWWVFSLNRAMIARTSAEASLRTVATILVVIIGIGAIFGGMMIGATVLALFGMAGG